jgi:UDPglucose--hexose-1-phosphate uridylyltransferase
VYRQRLVDLQRDPRLVYGMLFKNVGPGAGASLEHAHSQLIATPVVPISVSEEMSGSGKYFDERGRCIFCDIIRQELDDGRRMVLESAQFAAFCPFASRFPYETWVVPKEHGSHYEQLSRSTAEELAVVMRQVLGRLESALDRPAYNYIIHTAPFDTQQLRHYHWHIEIMPRLTNVAGFEWGTGFYINPVPPEEAAAFLRTAEVLSSRPSTPLTDSPLTEKSTTAQATKVAQQGKDAVETEAT